MSSQVHPLTAPYVAPGCWPGASEEDKELARQLVKQELLMTTTMESCMVKAGISGVAGFGLGAFFSLMTASFRYDDPFASPAMRDMKTSQKAAEMFKDMGRGMWKGGRNWGTLGLLFSGIECCIEGYRGKHDPYNVFAGGFITGCIISRKSGVKAGILSGIGFGTFGAAIDKLWVEKETPDPP